MCLDVFQVLLGDAGDGDVVNVDVLLANEVEQQIERAFVHLADGDGERESSSLQSARHRARPARGVFGRAAALGARLAVCRWAFVAHSPTLRLRPHSWPGSYVTVGGVARFHHGCLGTTRAFAEPAPGCPTPAADWLRIFGGAPAWAPSTFHKLSAAQPLHSMQPMPAVRQPSTPWPSSPVS